MASDISHGWADGSPPSHGSELRPRWLIMGREGAGGGPTRRAGAWERRGTVPGEPLSLDRSHQLSTQGLRAPATRSGVAGPSAGREAAQLLPSVRWRASVSPKSVRLSPMSKDCEA